MAFADPLQRAAAPGDRAMGHQRHAVARRRRQVLRAYFRFGSIVGTAQSPFDRPAAIDQANIPRLLSL